MYRVWYFMAILSKTTEDPEDPTFGQRLEANLHKNERKRESLDSDFIKKKLRKILTIQI